MKENQNRKQRFQASKRTIFWDRFMDRFIHVGGIGIILAVLGIFFFIFWEVLPLFKSAVVTPSQSFKLPQQSYKILGLDEWGELPFLVSKDGKIIFVDILADGQIQAPEIPEDKKTLFESIEAMDYQIDNQTLVFGRSGGKFFLVNIKYEPQFNDGKRRIISQLKISPEFSTEQSLGPIKELEIGGESDQVIGYITETPEGTYQVGAMLLTQSEGLLDEGTLELSKTYHLTPQMKAQPKMIRISEDGKNLLVADQKGEVYYFRRKGDSFKLIQRFMPFKHLSQPQIASMEFILGGASTYLTHENGENIIHSLYVHPILPFGDLTDAFTVTKGLTLQSLILAWPGIKSKNNQLVQLYSNKERLFGHTKSFPKLNGSAIFFSKSQRNRAFITGRKDFASLRFATTEEVLWENYLPFTIQDVALSKKYHRIAFLDTKHQLHLYTLKDPHPEAGWNAYFSKIWYEGAPKPDYVWQSTGGSDSFEPKLSLVPLIIGTLKGTFYALIFAVPIALLAAVYTAQFLNPKWRRLIKPTMEIMASLPSVILGFLAALWLAPLIEEDIPSILLVSLQIPISALIFGYFWSRLPIRWRAWLPHGYEWLLFIPILLGGAWLAWELGPALERWLFVVTDAQTGEQIADFRLWWPEATGTSFTQRNSLVVGFIMGFAVIPIIFTISEDSISAVPKTMQSASLALGASRWQTAIRIMIPSATAGIFSAIMIGFGRAVGETMIVLMATGNTAIMDFNIFSGMRTLSANLAVELPEAPFQGTLYRTLFFGALVLFLMTFFLNSLAEIMRQRIRNKFKGL